VNYVTPQVLWDVWQSGRLNRAELALYLSKTWGHAGADRHTALTHDQWRELFDATGYTDNGRLAAPPPGSLTLYRGSPAKHCANWSWTERLDVAEGYARQHHGQVWTLTAPTAALLAHRYTPLLDLDEYIVDTHGLEIHEYP
jgi:hypothetical protein